MSAMVDISETVHEFARLSGLTEEEAVKWSAWCLAAQAELEARLRGGVSWQEEHTRLSAAAAALACYRYRLAEQTVDPFQSFSAGDVKLGRSASAEIEAAERLKEEALHSVCDLLEENAFLFWSVGM